MADTKQLIRDVTTLTNNLAAASYSYQQWIGKVSTLYEQITNGMISKEEVKAKRAELYQIFTNLQRLNKSFGNNVSKFNKQIAPQIIAQLKGIPQQSSQVKTQALAYDLMKFADALDASGCSNLASKVDEFLKTSSALTIEDVNANLRGLIFGLIVRTNEMEKVQQKKAELVVGISKLAEFSDTLGAHLLADELDKMAEEEMSAPIQQPSDGTLSTRYCPDHIGTQTVRISERVYQCPLDGKVYNYEVGYKNYKGEQVPGGSIAAQTPSTSDYGGIPMRIYDSRQTILNRIN